jgi:hypothetical protein
LIALDKTLPTFGITLSELIISKGGTPIESNGFFRVPLTLSDLKNESRDLKLDLQTLGFVLGGEDFTNTDLNAIWVLTYSEMFEFIKVNPNFKVNGEF